MQQPKRYTYIDVLRGLAALMVVYQHTSEMALKPALHVNGVEETVIDFFIKVIDIGEVGVCIFLMISGFVVPFSLLKYKFDPIKNFAAHRFFRLYPAYWLSVPLGAIFVYWQFGAGHGGKELSWSTVLANFSMFQTYLGFDDIMGQYWTLALELMFYVLCAVLFLLKRLYSFKSTMFVLVSVLLIREISRHIPSIDAHGFSVLTMFRYLDFMFFGILYRQWLLDQNRAAGWQALLVLLFTFLSFGVLSDIRHFAGGDHLALRMSLSYLTAFIIFFSCTRMWQPSWSVGVFLGKISYSIYLFHPVIFYPLFFYWFQSSALTAYPHLFIFTSMALTVLVSSLTYHAIEKPCVALGGKLFSGKRPVAASTSAEAATPD